MWIAVHLDRDPRLGGGIEHRLDVARDRRSRQDVAAEGVSPDLEERVPHRAHEPSRHVARIEAVAVVDAGDHDVEPREYRVGKVERAVAQDVALGAAEQADAHALLHARDLVPLSPEPVDVEAVRIVRARRVVGDRQVLEAARLRRARHLLDRVAAVGVDRVAVDGAADVVEPDEVVGQRAGVSRFDLAGVSRARAG
jgi:hypothetical protein